MSLTLSDLERLEEAALDRIALKTKQARAGNDCVADAHQLNSFQLLDLLALAKLGLPLWLKQDPGALARAEAPV